MDTRHRHSAGPELVRHAESLIRSLSGVVHARVESDDRGIDAIHVTAADDDAATHMAAHVRSALLAGLATPIVAGRIHVRVDPAADRSAADRSRADADTRAATADADTRAATNGGARNGGRHRIRLIHETATDDDDGNDTADTGEDRARTGPAVPGHDAPGAGARPAGALASPEPLIAGAAAALDDDAASATAAPDRAATAAVPGDVATTRRRAIDRLRLVAVDVQRQDNGRVLCRVAIAYAARVHRAEAIAIDLPGAAAQAAAQAAVRAMVDAGLHGLELSGLREVEIAGREYVLVALRRTEGRIARDRSGSAAMIGSPERSAAEAAVAAADALI